VHKIRNLLIPVAVGSALVVGTSLPAGADEPSGSATGVDALVDTVVTTIDVPPVPQVVLPPGGSDGLVDLDVPGALSAGVLAVTSTGANGTDANSSASVAAVDAVEGIITAALITSVCAATPDGFDATSALTEAAAAGVPLDATPPPNTGVDVPAVGSVVLNEQETTANGVTVRAVHATIDTPVLGAELVISESACFAGTAGEPAEPTPGTPNLAG
jgi:hypothetical protein